MIEDSEEKKPFKRRPRYKGKNPRRFEDKYKEHDPNRYGETVAKVIASGKTPAGQHIPIMVKEIMDVLAIQSGDFCVDCTLGYGGHSSEILRHLNGSGQLLSIDQDPIEIVKTEGRLREQGYSEDQFLVRRSNFAGLPKLLAEFGKMGRVDALMADLGLSSMQIDDPSRGFTFKFNGPLDMRMNPNKGFSASDLIKKTRAEKIGVWLHDYSDEPHHIVIADAIAGKSFERTKELEDAILAALPSSVDLESANMSVRRTFQAIRIQVNEEFVALDNLLRVLPNCIASGARVAVLTFHSGEDRRVKKSFQTLHRAGIFSSISDSVIRAGSEERRSNPRATSAKLRWAIKA